MSALQATFRHVVSMQVSLIGNESEFVCSGSDGGSIFIWNAKSGQLVNVMRANDTVTTCVAPHPHVPMLASCGFEPAVRLWSPEVRSSRSLCTSCLVPLHFSPRTPDPLCLIGACGSTSTVAVGLVASP